ncbi:MAG TPA: hypothetical protein VN843_07025 [Anaerolineales bacterium]|nr:hypothetical protein [Anaerolineales bacterium]
MMKTPTEFQTAKLLSHIAANYDPVKAHKYYEEHKKLKGRKPAQVEPHGIVVSGETQGRGRQGTSKKTMAEIHKGARERQRKELTAAIRGMEARLHKLEALIKKREHEAASEDRKSKAKKERAAKEKDKPQTAAEKAKAARENKKYRDKHKQEIKTKAKKEHSSGGGSSSGSKSSGTHKASLEALKSLATRVRGQLALAKKKLAAL